MPEEVGIISTLVEEVLLSAIDGELDGATLGLLVTLVLIALGDA